MMVYATTTLNNYMFFLKSTCDLYTLYDIIFLESSMSFSVTSWLVTVTMTMSSNVTDVWQCNHDITLILTLNLNKENKSKKKKRIK